MDSNTLKMFLKYFYKHDETNQNLKINKIYFYKKINLH